MKITETNLEFVSKSLIFSKRLFLNDSVVNLDAFIDVKSPHQSFNSLK